VRQNDFLEMDLLADANQLVLGKAFFSGAERTVNDSVDVSTLELRSDKTLKKLCRLTLGKTSAMLSYPSMFNSVW
jgi:hypothetical protein